MDSELIRTFLEVHRTRHFGRAAERLFVTPAAVSARVRLLEEQLGARLFIRSRNNIGLTAAGQRLLPHAENLLRGWNRAMLSVGTTDLDQELVAVGSLNSIFSVLLPGWLPRLYARRPDLMVQLELLATPTLVTRVREQSLDLALVYEAPQARDLLVDAVGALQLVLVASEPGLNAKGPLAGYVHVDWGTPFSMTLAREVPELSDPVLRVDAPEVALEFVRARGGAAFLPRPLVQGDLEAGRLHGVAGAPVIERRVYLIESANAEASSIRQSVRADLEAWLTGPVNVPR